MNQPPPPPPSPGTGGTAGPSPEVRNWAMGAHLSAFVGAMVALAFLGPLTVWLFKRDQHPFIDEHAREALNFNLSLLVYLFAGTVLSGVLALITFGLFLIVAIPLGLAAAGAWIVLTVLAAIAASEGRHYRYPLTIRFVQ